MVLSAFVVGLGEFWFVLFFYYVPVEFSFTLQCLFVHILHILIFSTISINFLNLFCFFYSVTILFPLVFMWGWGERKKRKRKEKGREKQNNDKE